MTINTDCVAAADERQTLPLFLIIYNIIQTLFKNS